MKVLTNFEMSIWDFEIATVSSNIHLALKQIDDADVVVLCEPFDFDSLGIFWRAVQSKKPTIVIDSLKESTWRDYWATQVVKSLDEALPIIYRFKAELEFVRREK